jgi:HEAT repeat protein
VYLILDKKQGECSMSSPDPEIQIWIEDLKSSDVEVALDAVAMLGEVGDNRAVDALIETMQSKELIAQALAQLKDAKTTLDVIVVWAWGDDISRLQVASAAALAQIGDRRAVADLQIATRDYRNPRLQIAAYDALAELRAVEVVSHLIELLKDKTPIRLSNPISTCEVAARTLEKIGTPEALAAVKQWRDQA